MANVIAQEQSYHWGMISYHPSIRVYHVVQVDSLYFQIFLLRNRATSRFPRCFPDLELFAPAPPQFLLRQATLQLENAEALQECGRTDGVGGTSSRKVGWKRAKL